ncbi:MAG: hypothetical protein HDQ93_05435, partial [Desulfovibrio sp.]|nr:hypothetical protein [Desulfovibrio sp.]
RSGKKYKKCCGAKK